MDDLSAKLSQILGSEEGMAQLRNMAASLGLMGDGQNQNPPPATQSSVPEQSGTQGADFSAVASMLSGLMGGGNQSPNPAPAPVPSSPPQSGTPDLSGLMGMLSGMMNNTGGGLAQTPAPMPSMPNIDMNTILTLQKAYSTFTARDKNTELLLALRPHFSQERQKKVDDAIRILGLIKILPLLKESGILGSLGGLLGGDDS